MSHSTLHTRLYNVPIVDQNEQNEFEPNFLTWEPTWKVMVHIHIVIFILALNLQDKQYDNDAVVNW